MNDVVICLNLNQYMGVVKKHQEALDPTINPEADGIRVLGNQAFMFSLSKIPLSTMNRARAETDSGYVQVIPYIMVVRASDKKVLSFITDENAVLGHANKISIGFCDHIEESNADLVKAIIKKMQVIMGKQLHLELSDEFVEAITHQSHLGITFDYCDDGAFAKYHLAAYLMLTVEDDEVDLSSITNVNNLQFSDVNELLEDHQSGNNELESWSYRMLSMLAPVF